MPVFLCLFTSCTSADRRSDRATCGFRRAECADGYAEVHELRQAKPQPCADFRFIGRPVLKVIKSLNNNMVLASDDNGRECIYKGKGIGFQKKKGDPVEMDKIERSFVPASEEESRHFQQLFSEIPEEYWDMAGKVVEYARTRRKLKVTDITT